MTEPNPTPVDDVLDLRVPTALLIAAGVPAVLAAAAAGATLALAIGGAL